VCNFYYSRSQNHHYENDFLEKTYGDVLKSTDARTRGDLMQKIAILTKTDLGKVGTARSFSVLHALTMALA